MIYRIVSAIFIAWAPISGAHAQPAQAATGAWVHVDLLSLTSANPQCKIAHVVERRLLLNPNPAATSRVIGRYFRMDSLFFILKGDDECQLPGAPAQAMDARMLCWVLDGVESDTALPMHAIYDPRQADGCIVPPDQSREFKLRLTPTGPTIIDDGDSVIGGRLIYRRKEMADEATDRVRARLPSLFETFDAGECGAFVANSLTPEARNRLGTSTAEFCSLRDSIRKSQPSIARMEFPMVWQLSRHFPEGRPTETDVVLASGHIHFHDGSTWPRAAILKADASGNWKIDALLN